MLRSSATSFYEADGLGSVTSLTSTAGALAQTYTLDSFGRQTASSGSLTNPFQYTGREIDPETSLYYYRARYYDPTNGRFASEDSVRFRAGKNFYSYVRDNLVNFFDPRGKWAGGFGGIVGGIIGTPSIAGSGEGSCALVFDSQGNLGILCCLAFGGGTVVPAGGSLSLQGAALDCPNCKTICDMQGGFVAGQAFAADVAGAAGGVSLSLTLKNATITVSGGPAGGVGGGAAILGGSCKLFWGGSKCKDCPGKE